MKKIVLLLIGCIVAITLTGCGKTIEVPVYVYNKTPILETYEPTLTYEFGKLYNKDSGTDTPKVCVKRWNSCLLKKDFIELVDYMQDVRSTLTKSNGQIVEYNKWSEEQNKR